jgi:transcriptional regulator with XRE-family HTH domain
MPASRARPDDEALAQEFGRRLKAARAEAGLTQEQLAEGAGVHPTFISNMERGYSSPTLGTLVRLAAALGSDPADLVSGLRP